MSASGTLSSSVSVQCFAVVIIDDTAVENEELFTVSISVPPNLHNVVITQQNVTILISDDDGWLLLFL